MHDLSGGGEPRARPTGKCMYRQSVPSSPTSSFVTSSPFLLLLPWHALSPPAFWSPLHLLHSFIFLYSCVICSPTSQNAHKMPFQLTSQHHRLTAMTACCRALAYVQSPLRARPTLRRAHKPYREPAVPREGPECPPPSPPLIPSRGL